MKRITILSLIFLSSFAYSLEYSINFCNSGTFYPKITNKPILSQCAKKLGGDSSDYVLEAKNGYNIFYSADNGLLTCGEYTCKSVKKGKGLIKRVTKLIKRVK